MAWIESHQSLGTHRKLYALMDALHVDDLRAVGLLHYLWWWALDNTPNGRLTGLSDRDIARACHWRGRPAALVGALCLSGWLEGAPPELVIHDWVDYAGKLQSRREANKMRMRAARNTSACAQHVSNTCATRAPATVPNSTVPNSTVPVTPLTPLTENDDHNDLKKRGNGTTDEVALDAPDLPDQDPLLARCVKVWEDNTAQLITPGVADGIAGLIEQYEPLWGDRDWFGDGVRAAFLAHRGAGGINLKFVAAILGRWAREGYPGKAPDSQESYELAEDMITPNISVASAVEIAEGRKRANAYNTEAAIEGLRRRGIAFTPKEHPD